MGAACASGVPAVVAGLPAGGVWGKDGGDPAIRNSGAEDRRVDLEGEIFVRYQLDVEAAHTEPVILCGFANGCIGYVPTADEYERGGYEVDIAYKVYPSTLMIAPESDRLIRQGIVDLLRILAQPYTVTAP